MTKETPIGNPRKPAEAHIPPLPLILFMPPGQCYPLLSCPFLVMDCYSEPCKLNKLFPHKPAFDHDFYDSNRKQTMNTNK